MKVSLSLSLSSTMLVNGLLDMWLQILHAIGSEWSVSSNTTSSSENIFNDALNMNCVMPYFGIAAI